MISIALKCSSSGNSAAVQTAFTDKGRAVAVK